MHHSPVTGAMIAQFGQLQDPAAGMGELIRATFRDIYKVLQSCLFKAKPLTEEACYDKTPMHALLQPLCIRGPPERSGIAQTLLKASAGFGQWQSRHHQTKTRRRPGLTSRELETL